MGAFVSKRKENTGCGVSKAKKSQLTRLCRERKDFVKAAVNCRYDLAAAHAVYTQSLVDVGNALRKFMDEDLFVITDDDVSSVSSVGSSHFNFSDSEFDVDSVPKNSDKEKCPTNSPKEDEHSKAEGEQCKKQASSSNTPSAPEDVQSDGFQFKNEFEYAPFYWQPRYQYQETCVDTKSVSSHVVYTNPETETIYWDYLKLLDDAVHNAYAYSNWESPDLTMVKQSEGIPDLEDDSPRKELSDGMKVEKKTEQNSGKKQALKKTRPEEKIDQNVGEKRVFKKTIAKEATKQNVAGKGVSKATEAKEQKNRDSDGVKKTKDEERVDGKVEPNESAGTKGQQVKGQRSDSERKPDLNLHAGLLVRKFLTFQEASKEIADAFEASYNYCKDVTRLLEVGKPYHEPIGVKVKALTSHIGRAVTPSAGMASQYSTPLLACRHGYMKIAKALGRRSGSDEIPSQKLSSTLEQLYSWEKRLYDEVKIEEQLQFDYIKECKQLKALDEAGAEFIEIDRTRTSIRNLLSKLNASVAAVDAIALQIHRLRDQELYPCVSELINGFSKMWKSMIKSHQKQLEVIENVKNCLHITSIRIQTKSRLKAAKKLEKEILTWAARFIEYVKIQKAFVNLLNEWLQRCISQDLNATQSQDVPLSPSSIGAPPIFVVCNDWLNATLDVSEDAEHKAILSFASSLHSLRENRKKEQRLSIRTRNMSRDLRKQIKLLHEIGAVKQCDIERKELDLPSLREQSEDLAIMKSRLDELKTKHKEAIQNVKDAASNSLWIGLLPTLNGLEKFWMDSLKTHEKIRISKGNQSRV